MRGGSKFWFPHHQCRKRNKNDGSTSRAHTIDAARTLAISNLTVQIPVLPHWLNRKRFGMTMNARKRNSVETQIRRFERRADAKICARMMANSEPWVTLRRDYDASLKILTDPSRVVYLAVVGNEIVGFTVLNIYGAFTGYLQSVCVAPRWRGKGV
jgi:ribosomal protein S18 acetylase RimI-like enzyme